ncbi:MAG: phosphatase PAP2 family protein [Candidatus Methylacidiphilales bacterium]
MRVIFGCLLVVLLFKISVCNAQSDSIYQNKKTSFKKYVIPTLLITYGISSFNNNGLLSSIAVKDFRNEHFSQFNTSIDDYLVFAPGLLILGLDAFKIKSSSNFINQAAITTKSVILSIGVVNILKYSTQVMRPDNSTENSFPSGHTAFAFTLAEVLHQEFKDKPLVYISGYTIASAAGAMRILNNRHWFTDVMVGAGIGMISTHLIYATHQYKWKLNKGGFFPIVGINQAGFTYKF